jgi:hypothetical protein
VTTSYGTGELITAALDAGARHLILGIGGSATNDGGAGMLQALGVQLLDAQGLQLGRGGAPLAQLDRIDASGLDVRLAECTIEVACDVDNPLTGPRGASAIFGPQKGATPEMVQQLDANLQHFARIILRDVGADVDAVAGAGAAGGMGAAMLAFLKGQLRPGCEIIAKAVGLEAAVKDADLVVTGEGRIDQQTIFGKTPFGVATVAKQFGKPVVGIAGAWAPMPMWCTTTASTPSSACSAASAPSRCAGRGRTQCAQRGAQYRGGAGHGPGPARRGLTPTIARQGGFRVLSYAPAAPPVKAWPTVRGVSPMKLVHSLFTAVHAVIALLFALAALTLVWIAARAAWSVWSGGLDADATLHMVQALGILASGVVALQIAQTVVEEEVVRDAHISGPTRVRRFLSRFLVVLVVALAIEGLVATFKARKTGQPAVFVGPDRGGGRPCWRGGVCSST